MPIDAKIFKSRLAWRFFSLFIACALVPILSLALLAYFLVVNHLEEQAYRSLRSYAQTHAMSIYEQFLLAEQHLQFLGAILFDASRNSPLRPESMQMARTNLLFNGVGGIIQGRRQNMTDQELSSNAFDAAVLASPLPGRSILAVMSDASGHSTLLLVHRPEQAIDTEIYLLGLLREENLWQPERGIVLPDYFQWSVWDDKNNVLYSSLSSEEQTKVWSGATFTNAHAGTAVISAGAIDYYSAFWSMFTQPQFHLPYLKILVMQPKDSVLEPFILFRNLFPLVVMLSLAIVVYLSSVAIRKSLTPIDNLMEGARQVAQGCFTHRVDCQSKDEFAQLAVAFNHMSSRLDSHFKLLSARSELDRDILSLLEIDLIIEKLLPRLSLFLPCKVGVVAFFDWERSDELLVYQFDNDSSRVVPRSRTFRIDHQDQAFFNTHPQGQEIRNDGQLPVFLQEIEHPEISSWILFSVPQKDLPAALICFGITRKAEYTTHDLDQARQLAEHIAVAFSKAHLVHELKQLNLGASQALARAVDAKSPWTAGHSERVSKLSIDMARMLGHSPEELFFFRHATLLHDIGKIGVPSSILDKKDKLSAEEFGIIKTHPSVGARILMPIHAYQQMIPIVVQHHERYNGSGYPNGLAGEEIHPLARILTVADSFDAMVSDRPYRKGMPVDVALNIIIQESGKLYDPFIVDTFVEMIRKNLNTDTLASEYSISPAI